MMKELDLKRRLGIVLLLISIGVFLIVSMIFIPTIRAIQKSRETIVSMHKELEQKREKTKFLRQTLRELDRALTFARQSAQTTVIQGKELDIIRELEEVSQRHSIQQSLSVSLEPIDPTRTNIAGQLKNLGISHAYAFSFNNKGTFQNHLAYLRSLEELPYYVIIHDLHVERQEQARGEPTSDILTLRFVGRVYISGQ